MAITALGSLGTAQVKSAGVPLTFSPSRAVPVGRFVVLYVSTDSVHNSGGPHGPMQERWAAHDDEGNIWVTLGGETDGSGFFKVGASSHIFVSQLRRALTTSSVITITNQAEANIDAKALSAEEFFLGAGMKWATTDQGPALAESLGVTDPVAISISGLVSQEYLLLHCLGSEGPDTDTFTWDADYTQIVGTGTTGGVDDSNINVRGGYRIATLTSDTVSVDSAIDRDHTQVLVAVCAVPHHNFPAAPLLDDFERADEDPLDNGTWRTDVSSGPSSPGTPRFLQLLSNRAAAAPIGAGGQWWDEILSGCVEIRVDIPDAPTADAGGVSLNIHGTGDSSQANMASGAACHWINQDFGETLHPSIIMGIGGNSGHVGEPKLRAWVDLEDGYKIGMRRSTVASNAVDRLFVDVGDGWEQIAAIQRIGGITGGPSRSSGWLGLAVWDSVTRVDNFGGHEVNCFGATNNLPQIIRRRKRRGSAHWTP